MQKCEVVRKLEWERVKKIRKEIGKWSELRERIEINSGKSMLSFDELQSIYNLQLYYLHVNKF